MSLVYPITLQHQDIQLEPLSHAHEEGIKHAAADGELWQLRFTSVPEPDDTRAYIEKALATADRFAFAVRHLPTDTIIGTSSYHDILESVRRLEIGWTWYAKRYQRTHVNTICKYLLLVHAFETLACHVVGWRTDQVNFASQHAIERLGAKKDGVIRGHAPRRDGTVRDTVMYSMTRQEWYQGMKAHLQWLMRERQS
jgi:N-acetyltransferase